jgi:hypothetical protein
MARDLRVSLQRGEIYEMEPYQRKNYEYKELLESIKKKIGIE